MEIDYLHELGITRYVVKPVNNNTLINNLADDVAGCQKCQLSKLRHSTEIGFGNINADLLIVSMLPQQGVLPDNSTQHVVAMKLLSNMLSAIQLDITDVYFTSLLKCKAIKGFDIQQNYIENCTQYFLQQLEIVKPKCILSLGRAVTAGLYGGFEDDINITNNCVGSNNVPVITTYALTELILEPLKKQRAYYELLQVIKIINN